MTRPVPAVDYLNRMVRAIRKQVDEERAVALLERQTPCDAIDEELRNALRAAALMRVEAYAACARRCSDAFEDAAAHEMGEVTPLRFGQDERHDEDDVA